MEDLDAGNYRKDCGNESRPTQSDLENGVLGQTYWDVLLDVSLDFRLRKHDLGGLGDGHVLQNVRGDCVKVRPH